MDRLSKPIRGSTSRCISFTKFQWGLYGSLQDKVALKQRLSGENTSGITKNGAPEVGSSEITVYCKIELWGSNVPASL